MSHGSIFYNYIAKTLFSSTKAIFSFSNC